MAGPWDQPPLKVRIVQRPQGEAPEWVRDAWIGLELGLLDPEPISTAGYGVLTGPGNLVLDWLWHFLGRSKKVEGYRVRADIAVELLSQSRPDAAKWWRDNAAYSVRRGAQFIFDTAACEPAS